jgi:hypothetical protein
VHWISARTFRARLVVPAAPWIEGDPVRVAPLVSGTYPIGVQCLVVGKGCTAERVEGVAEFRLQVRRSLAWCRTSSSCARLRVTPGRAAPGAVVNVTGFAPLVSIIGSDQPFAFQFVVLNGRRHGPQVRLGTFEAGPSAVLGRAALDVVAPASFSSLRDTAPIDEVSAGLSPISAHPAVPSTVAWCAAGAVDVQSDGMSTSIPTDTAVGALTRLGVQPAAGVALRCDAVALAAVVAAGFPAAPARYGGPPFYEIALTTTDHGQTWTSVPVPAGASGLSFGAFRYQAGGVEAVFATATANRIAPAYPNLDPNRPLAELSTGNGNGWQATPLGCPPAGPCVTLGPYLHANCAMNETTQPVLRSTDAGVRWSKATLPDQVEACAEAELVATSDHSDLLIDSMSQFPLQATNNGGATWHDIGLPPAPGEHSDGLGEGPGGITPLPDGDLLLSGDQGYRGGWELLRHGGRAWCTVHAPTAHLQALPQFSAPSVIGNQLWWLTGAYGAPTADHVALSALSC